MLKPMAAALAALALLAACATTEPEPQPVADTPAEETYAAQIERLAMEGLARDLGGELPDDLQVSVVEIDELEAGLFYKVELLTATSRRRDQDYVLYGQCLPTDIARCAEQVVSAARMLRE